MTTKKLNRKIVPGLERISSTRSEIDYDAHNNSSNVHPKASSLVLAIILLAALCLKLGKTEGEMKGRIRAGLLK